VLGVTCVVEERQDKWPVTGTCRSRYCSQPSWQLQRIIPTRDRQRCSLLQ